MSDSTPPFSSRVALATATARAKRALSKALPKSPRRRKTVHQKLYESEVDNSSSSPTSDLPRRSDTLSDETVELVKEFYQQDDISRQAPGRKDIINVRDKNRQKVSCQTHHLTASVMETYALFCKVYPNKIGKSTFAELRPKHVLLSSELPHNVCLCKYHKNFINAVNALHKVSPSVPLYTHKLPQTCLCDPMKRECWMNQCESAKMGRVLPTLIHWKKTVLLAGMSGTRTVVVSLLKV